MHGESCICASVDVREHPAVRRLAWRHLHTAKTSSEGAVSVILAPYGLAATLTGVTYKKSAQVNSTCSTQLDRIYDESRQVPSNIILGWADIGKEKG